MTATEEKLELIKCMSDPQYFLDNHGYCFNADTSQIDKITCYDYQEEAISNFEEYQNNIVLKSRQTGFSVITAGYIAWTLIFRSDQRVFIIANDGASAIRLLKTVKDYVNNIPEYLMPKEIIKNNEKYMEFSNGSWVRASACSPQAGRGEALTLLVVDEVAFIEKDEDIKAGALMAVSRTGGKTIMISTPYGTGNLYHQTWTSSIKKNNNYHRQIVHWTKNPFSAKGLEKRVNPDNGKEEWWSPWYQEQCERLGWDKVKIAQELDLSFESSKYLVIDSDIIQFYEEMVRDIDPVEYFDYNLFNQGKNPFTKNSNRFWVWKRPEKDHKYILASDVSLGSGKDYSTIQIIDAVTLEQVAELQTKVDPDILADIIVAAAKVYNEAFVVIEINNMGLTTGTYAYKTHKYKNIYKSKSIVEIWSGPRDSQWKVDEGGEIPGFQTTTKTRPFLITSLQKYLREKQVKLNSERLVSEFRTFVVKANGKAEHEKGANDDLLFAFMIALFIRDAEWDKIVSGQKMYKAMMDAWSVSTTDYRGRTENKNQEILKKKAQQRGEKRAGIDPIFVIGSTGNVKGQDDDDDIGWLYD